MFDMTIDAMAAFNQMMFLTGGGLLFLLGAFLAGNALYWLVHALAIPGVIIGLRQKSSVFYPVYRYILPSGEIFENVSESGSNLLRGKETGRQVTLHVFADDPLNIRSDLRGMVLLGAFLIALSVWPLWTAFTGYAWTSMSWLGVAVFAVVAVRYVRKIMIPRGQRLTRDKWKAAIREKRQQQMQGYPLTTLEAYKSTPEGALRVQQAAQSNRIMMPVLLVAGLGLLGGAVYTGNDIRQMHTQGLRADGIVVELAQSRDGDSTTYYPRVRFTDAAGETHTFKSNSGSNPPSYRIDAPVRVLYLPQTPEDSARIDGGWKNWCLPVLLLLGGALCLGGGLRLRQILREEQT